MRLDNVEETKRIKILLLGAGESGKTTLFKQMRLLYGQNNQFSAKEKSNFSRIIYKNVLTDLKRLLLTVEQRGEVLGTDEAIEASKLLSNRQKYNPRNPPVIDANIASIYKAIWLDPTVQQVWNTRDNIQIQDAFKYYMNTIDNIAQEGWTPSNQDILRARARTTGFVTSKFSIDKTTFEMYDVGGQRTERKKWIHYFDEVTTVLFVAAISEYNQVLYEDSTVNRQTEALDLFREQLSLANFNNTPFILFLNKKDLFREKITQVPFCIKEGTNRRNMDFQGPYIDLNKKYSYEVEGEDNEFEECYMAAIRYLVTLYESQNPGNRGQAGHIYSHPTNSTDSENIRRIMNNCKDIILNGELTGGGWV